MIEVRIIETNKKDFLDLLLLADESESMIDKYLAQGELFALYDGGLKSICIVTQESDDSCELKNIATDTKWHGKGYGTKLLNYIFLYYKDKYKTMLVGTGDSPWILQFYQKNGFVISHRIQNFFIDNYDHPMVEAGVPLVDMVYLKRTLHE